MAPNTISRASVTEETQQTTEQKVDLEQKLGYDSIFGNFQQRLIYSNIILIALFHLASLYSLLIFPYIQQWHLVVFGTVTGIMGGCGVTATVHRYYTHRTFKAKLPLVIIFLIIYAMAGHNKIFDWVRDHRVHHKFSETDADPHNANRGFFFSHVGWLMMKKHPEVTRKGRMVDMSDIANDPLVKWYDRHFVLMKLIFCFALPTIIPPVLWGASWYYAFLVTITRYIAVLNFTWLVNSAAHLYGAKPYDKRINPGENLLVSFFSLGEGWHNYHHTFPWDYRASELGKLNLTTTLLHLVSKIGWCYDFKYPSDELVRRVAIRYGDGTHERYGHVEIPENEELIEEILRKES